MTDHSGLRRHLDDLVGRSTALLARGERLRTISSKCREASAMLRVGLGAGHDEMQQLAVDVAMSRDRDGQTLPPR
jgi:hypothetical protein